MNNPEQSELLDFYKLHAELADRVSQRREGANRVYASLVVGLVVFLGILLSIGTEEVLLPIVLFCTGFIGMSLSISWYVVLRSYRQLNSGKFVVLHELEQLLEFPFFRREWDYLGKGEKPKKYWKLSTVETALPCIFLLFFLSLIGFSVFCFFLSD